MQNGDAAKVNDVTDQADSSVLSIGVRIEYCSDHFFTSCWLEMFSKSPAEWPPLTRSSVYRLRT